MNRLGDTHRFVRVAILDEQGSNIDLCVEVTHDGGMVVPGNMDAQRCLHTVLFLYTVLGLQVQRFVEEHQVSLK
jgi:hypothetical protein